MRNFLFENKTWYVENAISTLLDKMRGRLCVSFDVQFSPKKNQQTPINVSDTKLDILSKTPGCSKGSLPFTYLGLPLSLTRPTVSDYWPLVSRCERRLVSISTFLGQARRLQLTNAVFSALPTFAMSTYLLPKTVIKQIDKL